MDKLLYKKGNRLEFLTQEIENLQRQLQEKNEEFGNEKTSMQENVDRFFEDHIFRYILESQWDAVSNYLTSPFSKGTTVEVLLADAIVNLYSGKTDTMVVLPKNEQVTKIIFEAIGKDYGINAKLITGENALQAAKKSYKGYCRKNWEYYSLEW